AGPNPMAIAPLAHDVLYPCLVLDLIPGERCSFASSLGQQLTRLPVVIDIHQERKLDGKARIDHGFRPRTSVPSWVLPPGDHFRKPTDRHKILVAIAVHIDRQVTEGIDVVVSVV